jgi:hypothetical protein
MFKLTVKKFKAALALDNNPAEVLRNRLAWYCEENECSEAKAIRDIAADHDYHNGTHSGDWGGVTATEETIDADDYQVEYTTSCISTWMSPVALVEQALSSNPDGLPDWFEQGWIVGPEGESREARAINVEYEWRELVDAFASRIGLKNIEYDSVYHPQTKEWLGMTGDAEVKFINGAKVPVHLEVSCVGGVSSPGLRSFEGTGSVAGIAFATDGMDYTFRQALAAVGSEIEFCCRYEFDRQGVLEAVDLVSDGTTNAVTYHPSGSYSVRAGRTRFTIAPSREPEGFVIKVNGAKKAHYAKLSDVVQQMPKVMEAVRGNKKAASKGDGE